MVVPNRRTQSGVRAVVPEDVAAQRIGIARLGGETGRWSSVIVETAVAIATRAPPNIGPNEWVQLLDELAADFARDHLARATLRPRVGKAATKKR